MTNSRGRIALPPVGVCDRAVVIFQIFLEVGHGSYIEIEDFENEPLVLEPF